MDQNIRTKLMIGNKNYDNLANARVMLVGLGGVGGSCLEMLSRAGVRNIIVIDYDTFEISNLNRQLLSTYDVIGKSKVSVAEKRVMQVNDKANIIKYNSMVNEEFLNDFNHKVDYIIDACDDVKAKVLLIKYAINNNINIISCCGTGNRIKPDKLMITNIWKTNYDPLARKLRYELRKCNITNNINVVSSIEKPLCKSTDIIGSMPCVPNAAGILLASYVINDIVNDNIS